MQYVISNFKMHTSFIFTPQIKILHIVCKVAAVKEYVKDIKINKYVLNTV